MWRREGFEWTSSQLFLSFSYQKEPTRANLNVYGDASSRSQRSGFMAIGSRDSSSSRLCRIYLLEVRQINGTPDCFLLLGSALHCRCGQYSHWCPVNGLLLTAHGSAHHFDDVDWSAACSRHPDNICSFGKNISNFHSPDF